MCIRDSRWTNWFKIAGVQYPENGFVKIDGKTYYYEGGQYVVSVTKNIGGVDYTFGADGALQGNPPPVSYTHLDVYKRQGQYDSPCCPPYQTKRLIEP